MADTTIRDAAGHESAHSETVLAALSDVLGYLGRPDFDVTEVLQAVIEHARRLCRADTGNIARRDGDVFRVVAFVGLGDEYEAMVRQRPYRPERASVIGRALLERDVVHIHDVLADPEYALRDLQRAGRYRTLLGVPLLWNEEPIGVVAMARNDVAPYSEADIRIVSVFAEHAALAIRIATLLAETREALDRETAVSEVLKTISRSVFDLEEVLQTVVRSAVELGRAEFGNILRLDESSGVFRVIAHHGWVDPAYWELVRQTPYRPDRGTLIGRTLVELRPVHIVDVLEDPEYRFWEAQRHGGYRTILGVPMMRDGAAIGLFVVWRREVKPFSEREIALLTTFADQAVLAIENVRLFQTVERQRTELARFAPQVASLLSSQAGEQLLAGHRREITALFADLRGFTAFAEQAEPEELLGVLREYHATVGDLVVRNGGTVEHFAGDGLMAFFNDPTPVPEHQRLAVRTALEIRERFDALAAAWRKRGYELGLGIGIAVGYATLGRIGFEGRYDYGAVGNVVILASRLSDAAAPGEILIAQRVNAAVDDEFATERVADLALKGFSRPVAAFSLTGHRAM